MKRVYSLLANIVLLSGLFIGLLPQSHTVHAADDCVIQPAPSFSTEYGQPFEIKVWGKGVTLAKDSVDATLTITSVDTQFPPLEKKETNHTGKDVTFNFSGEEVPYGYDSAGKPQNRKYNVYVNTKLTGENSNPDKSCGLETQIIVQPPADAPDQSENPDDPNIPPTVYPTINPEDIKNGYTVEAITIRDGREIKDPNGEVNGTTSEIRVIFTGLRPNEEYRVCLQTDQEKCIKGDNFDLKELKAENGTLTLDHLCGAGSSALKQPKDDNTPKPCDPKKDYFHEGHVYVVGVYNAAYQSGPIDQVSVYVNFSYPHVYIETEEGGEIDAWEATQGKKSTDPIKRIANPVNVRIAQVYKAGGDDRNNFQVELRSQDYTASSQKCVELVEKNVGELAEVELSYNYGSLSDSDYTSKLPIGNYLLEIKEQHHEDKWNTLHRDKCQSGFVYYHIPITVKLTEDENSTYAEINTNDIVRDPMSHEFRNIEGDLEELGPLPCTRGKNADGEEVVVDPNATQQEKALTRLSIVECLEYSTALGTFSIEPRNFVADFAAILLGLASVAVLGYLIYGGWLILVSRGDKEKIQHAREVMTSAIIGLVFIVLSFVILTIITVDILRIPGFSR